MKEYIVSTETRPEVMIERGMETITRCRDCEYYQPWHGRKVSSPVCHYFSQWKKFMLDDQFIVPFFVSPDDYCSWGVPKP